MSLLDFQPNLDGVSQCTWYFYSSSIGINRSLTPLFIYLFIFVPNWSLIPENLFSSKCKIYIHLRFFWPCVLSLFIQLYYLFRFWPRSTICMLMNSLSYNLEWFNPVLIFSPYSTKNYRILKILSNNCVGSTGNKMGETLRSKITTDSQCLKTLSIRVNHYKMFQNNNKLKKGFCVKIPIWVIPLRWVILYY